MGTDILTGARPLRPPTAKAVTSQNIREQPSFPGKRTSADTLARATGHSIERSDRNHDPAIGPLRAIGGRHGLGRVPVTVEGTAAGSVDS